MKSRKINDRLYSVKNTPPSGSHHRRLNTLETHIQPAVSESPKRLTDQEWLDMLRLYAGQGLFDGEPDFPLAFAAYEEAIRNTSEDPEQHYHPPAEFMPNAKQLERERVWRHAREYPEIDAAWLWIAGIFGRLIHDEPGVALAEWEQLRSWFLRESPVWEKEDLSEFLDDMPLSSFRREVKDDHGKSHKTAKWIGILRQLWAYQYGRTS
jgi:hypothetical protein